MIDEFSYQALFLTATIAIVVALFLLMGRYLQVGR